MHITTLLSPMASCHRSPLGHESDTPYQPEPHPYRTEYVSPLTSEDQRELASLSQESNPHHPSRTENPSSCAFQDTHNTKTLTLWRDGELFCHSRFLKCNA